jgi:hypothetical protein
MKFIFVILHGADDVECKKDALIYEQMHDLSIQYYEKMRLTYDIDYFYVRYRPEQEDDLVELEHHIYLKGKEEFSKLYEKSVAAIRYLSATYSYDYIIRTNISSFWNIPTLFTLTFPSTQCLSGIVIFNSFISGTGIIISSDICQKLLSTELAGCYRCDDPSTCYLCDDRFISHTLINYAPFHGLHTNMMWYLTNDEKNVIPENKNDILYFRIKNGQNRQRDVELFKILLRDMYDIHA